MGQQNLTLVLWHLFYVITIFVSAIVALGLASSVLRKETGSEEYLQSDPYCVKWNLTPRT